MDVGGRGRRYGPFLTGSDACLSSLGVCSSESNLSCELSVFAFSSAKEGGGVVMLTFMCHLTGPQGVSTLG